MSVLFWGVGPRADAAQDQAPGAAPGAFVLEVDVPAPTILPGPDGTFRVRADGYGPYAIAPGLPNLPTRTLRVALPPDGDPRLTVRVLASSFRPGIVPTPLGEEALPDPAVYAGDAPWPERTAWLGTTGWLRYQRYVDVHLAPYRWDPSRRGLIVDRAVEIRIDYGATTARTAVPVDDSPVFERLYRDAFANAAESRSLRAGRAGGALRTTSAQRFPGARKKFLVDADGVVRLDYDRMLGSGFLVEPISTWRLENRGVRIPLHSNDDGDDLLEPGEWVQFYGQILDDEPPTELNLDIPASPVDLYEARDFTDVNAYFLSVSVDPLSPMAGVDATPGIGTPPTSFRDVLHAEVDDPNGYRPLGAADPWYWTPTLSTAPSFPVQRTDTLTLPGLVDGTADLDVRVRIRGITEDFAVDPDHETRVQLRNASSDLLFSDTQTFDGRTIFDHVFTWTWPGSGPQATSQVDVNLAVLTGPGVRNDVILDEIEIEYERAFFAVADRLRFTWPDEARDFEIQGFTTSNVEVWEITEVGGSPVAVPIRLENVAITGAGPFTARFSIADRAEVPDGEPRTFLAFADGVPQILPDPQFLEDPVSDLRDNAIQADYLVIAADAVLDETPGGALDQFLTWRQSPAGGGLTTKVARYSDIVDEFNFGLEGPDAIESFLRWVMSTQPGEGWADPRPTYVLLLGDGSFDYKGGPARGNYLPTQIVFKDVFELGYYASDNLLAAVVGDDSVPDLLVGRIPARTVEVAERVLQKIVDYEQLAPAGSWRSHLVTISDQGKPGNNPAEAIQFETINANSLAESAGQPYTTRDFRYWTDYVNPGVTMPWNAINDDIKDEVNGVGGIADGAAIVQMFGHGNFNVWSDDAFFEESNGVRDTLDLVNGLRLPWVMTHNCLTGGFHVTAENTMGEGWLKRDGGGAVGVFAPSALSFVFIGEVAAEEVWSNAFGLPKKRIVGEIALDVALRLCGQSPGTVDACQGYVLQGDPAMRLALPDVSKPTQLVATGGNAQVQLDWQPSDDPGVVYDVYRATALTGFGSGYTKVNGAPVATDDYLDTGVINAQEYFYYVIAVDAAGYESAASNLNGDCFGAETDCVRVTPLNPGPPSVPTGLDADDPGVGTILELSWNPNPEDDLSHYTLHFGTESGNLTASVVLDDTPFASVAGLVEGQTYYFAVSATNTSGNTSAPSGEVSDFPVFALGLRAPRFIDDLTLSVSGADLGLQWGEVTTDIFGKPLAVLRYDVLRAPAPAYGNEFLAKIGECPAPCTSFVDPGAAAAPDDWQYRVRAVSVAGDEGALGAATPRSVELSVAKSATPGNIVLHWPAVTTTVAGTPASVAEYLVFADDVPVTRQAIRDGLVTPIGATAGTSFELAPPAQDRFYSVIVVDAYGNRSAY